MAHSRISNVDQDLIAYRSGLELVDPSPSARHAIKAFLDKIKRGQRRRVEVTRTCKVHHDITRYLTLRYSR